MPKRVKITLITLLVVVTLALSFSSGCTLSSPGLSNTGRSSPPAGLDVVDQAWQIIQSQ